ncbi:GlsB/YeaQ/YmgE family stress response membrane protein [Patescibacteria group bacterium]|nr:MAG: GlsB/YeaQ/YmgE family stress response membrane protein [Patescibacteria group bacterium]
MSLLWFLIIGALAGWIAGMIAKGRGFGVLGNIVVGIVGAVVGGFVFQVVGIASYGLLGDIVMSVIGALLLLFVVSLFKRA